MRNAIWMLGLSLATSGLAAQADEVQGPLPPFETPLNPLRQGPIPQLETPLDQMRRVQPQPKIAVTELGANGSFRIEAQEAPVLDVLGEIAARGKLQVLVATDISNKLPWFALRGTAESVLRGLCYHEHLEVLRYGDALLVRLPRADAPEPAARPGDHGISLDFKDVRAREIVELLAVGSESGLVVEIEEALGDKKIPAIKLDNVTLKPALEAVALALGAQLAWKEGRYVLSAKPN